MLKLFAQPTSNQSLSAHSHFLPIVTVTGMQCKSHPTGYRDTIGGRRESYYTFEVRPLRHCLRLVGIRQYTSYALGQCDGSHACARHTPFRRSGLTRETRWTSECGSTRLSLACGSVPEQTRSFQWLWM